MALLRRDDVFSSHLTPFIAEVWSLYALGVVMTITRLASRLRVMGVRNLQADDSLAVLAIVFYTAQTILAYKGGIAYFSAKDAKSLDPDIIEGLSPENTQYKLWVLGAILHFVTWPTYGATLWALKLSILFLYKRLTAGLLGGYWTRIKIGFGLVGLSWLAYILTLFLTCRPFTANFSPHPYPSNACQPAVSRPIVWTTFSLNVLTDLYLMIIPMPLLTQANLKRWKKIGLLLLFSGGLIIVIFATVRCVLITKHPGQAAPISGLWAIRESFVAILTTNLPMNFGLCRKLLGPAFSTSRGQSEGQAGNLETYGSSGRRRYPGGATLSMMLIPSEEMIATPNDIEMPKIGKSLEESSNQENDDDTGRSSSLIKVDYSNHPK